MEKGRRARVKEGGDEIRRRDGRRVGRTDEWREEGKVCLRARLIHKTSIYNGTLARPVQETESPANKQRPGRISCHCARHAGAAGSQDTPCRRRWHSL